MANEVHSKHSDHSDLDQPEIVSTRKYHTTSSVLLLFGL